jgi:hypothetical protein
LLPSPRRSFLASATFGVSSVALANLLQSDGLLAAPVKPDLKKPVFDLLPKSTPLAPKATAMISLFMQGGPSHMDLFDPKPELNRLDGTKFQGQIQYDNAPKSWDVPGSLPGMVNVEWNFPSYFRIRRPLPTI